MSFLVWKTQPTLSEAENNSTNDTCTEDQEDAENLNAVTSHVYLKPAHRNETLDKEMVLRRIRQRKRHNKVRATLQRLFGPPVSSKTDNISIRWVDDAFAAP
ncbi:hypothetical protein JCGZ_04366 [Jatropha curcas]|uniref:Uncharacterized protein n=1 Tax=Jatropha curcas TaxID=180498 RepID=A0A067KQF0_JATCU|nr:hypothetical protein JCGZ_04366 [Jatropha curcas]